MTSETPEESRNASGEAASSDCPAENRKDERGAERPPSSEESRSSEKASRARLDGGIPLNIADHEEEKRKREQEASDGEQEAANGEQEAPDADERAIADDAEGDSDDSTHQNILGEDIDVDADDEEAEPVELLVQLAEEGEIEPWDIDIVTVTDKFLDRLDGADLRTSGRALFYASVLLRMKSDALLADDEEEEPEDPWDAWGPDAEMPMEGDGDFPDYDPVNQLEDEMERRLERKTARGSPETLDELVRELRERERGSWWKESRSYDTSESPSGFSRGTQTLDYRMDDDMRIDEEPSEDDVTGTTHEEDIEAVIDDVREELRTNYDKGREEVLYAEIDAVGGSRIQTYLALLFLSHRGTVVLEQDDMFGDLWVRDAAVVNADADDSEEAGATAD